MIGILLASHGKFAEGMRASGRLFFGKDIPQLETLCLMPEESPDEFREKMMHKINALNDGSGVIILCDLLFGTPCNQSASFIREDVKVVCGANMPLLLEILGRRNVRDEKGNALSLRDMDLKALLQIGSESICNLEDKL